MTMELTSKAFNSGEKGIRIMMLAMNAQPPREGVEIRDDQLRLHQSNVQSRARQTRRQTVAKGGWAQRVCRIAAVLLLLQHTRTFHTSTFVGLLMWTSHPCAAVAPP